MGVNDLWTLVNSIDTLLGGIVLLWWGGRRLLSWWRGR